MRLRLLPILALWLTPAIAHAETPTEKARRLYDLGNEAYKAGDTEIARGFYAEAFSTERSFGIALNLGAAELDLGQSRIAAEHLAYALRIGATGIGAKVRAAAEQKLATARGKVGALTVTGAAGCQLLVDGVPVGDPDAAELFVEPGERTLTASCDGGRKGRASVRAEAGKSATVSLSFDAPGPTPPPAGGAPRPSAESFGSAGGAPPRDLTVPLAVGLPVAGASVLAGAVLLGVGADQSAQADRDLQSLTGGCGADLTLCKKIDGHRRTADDLGIAGVVTLVGGAALGVGIVVVGLATSPRRPAQRAWITPTGAGFRLSF